MWSLVEKEELVWTGEMLCDSAILSKHTNCGKSTDYQELPTTGGYGLFG